MNKGEKWLTFVILACMCGGLFLLFVGTRVVKRIKFGIDVTGHLKRAADSNTPETAAVELATALKGMEDRQMTKGYTSILWRSPSEDVGFWYKNLSESLTELEELPEDATGLERSNMLMKLRETILDDTSEGGVTVTAPSGIEVFPNNKLFAFWGLFSAIFCGLFSFLAASSKPSSRYGRGSFTLIELMIVIAIIAILAAVLMGSTGY
jgi:prepilin-type N-terminal cleavage/methylation domain-containing protein